MSLDRISSWSFHLPSSETLSWQVRNNCLWFAKTQGRPCRSLWVGFLSALGWLFAPGVICHLQASLCAAGDWKPEEPAQLTSECAFSSFRRWVVSSVDFPGGAGGKEPACQCRRHETQVQPLGQQDPVLLPGESHGQRSLAGYSPQGCQELDMTEATYHARLLLCIHKYVDLKDN